MTEKELEIEFNIFCNNASELEFLVLMHGLLMVHADPHRVKRLENSYYKRFGHSIAQKELTSSVNEVSQ